MDRVVRLILGRSHIIAAPELSPSFIKQLCDYEFMDSPVKLREMDTFYVEHNGLTFPVFCYMAVGDVCRIRRMQEKEIAHNIKGVF